MPTPTSIAGALFTVKVGGTAYSHQIMDGAINGSTNIVTEFTLGPNQVDTATSTTDTVSINGLYDGSAGVYDAMWTAYKARTSIFVLITDGTAKQFAGNVVIESLNLPFGAQDSSKFNCSLRGPLTRGAITT